MYDNDGHLQTWPSEYQIKLPMPLSLPLRGSGWREVVVYQRSNQLPPLRFWVTQTHYMEVQCPRPHSSHPPRSRLSRSRQGSPVGYSDHVSGGGEDGPDTGVD